MLGDIYKIKDYNFMIIDKIRTILYEKGFQGIKVNVKGIYLLYSASEQQINIAALYDCPSGTELTGDQYKNIRNQLYKNYSDRNFTSVLIQSIICTSHVEAVRNFDVDDTNQWIIDLVNAKLIVYENKNADFMGIRKIIEEILLKEQLENMGVESGTGYTLREKLSAPLRQSIWIKYFSKCNTLLVILNVIIFFIIDIANSSVKSNYLLDAGALYWPAVKYYNQYYRLLTYMFLHSGIEHLANNMIVLLIIGDNVERAAGRWKYMVFFFGSGIIAGITSMSYNMVNNTNAVSVGASGAIFGVVGAMAFIVAVNRGRLENISTRQILIFVVLSLYGGLTSQGVDNAAHIGGLAAGILLAAVLYRKHKKSEPERG